MPLFSNLISESVLVTETIQYLRSTGGRASAVRVVDRVMKIRRPEPEIARLLVSELAEQDPRLVLDEDHLEIIDLDADSLDIAEADYVVIDLETTGAKAPPCRVTEIGACKIRKGKVTEEFHTLVNPETSIPPFITSLTGISDAMVREAPRFSDIAGDLLEFIGDSVLVAHNARFDMGFLNYEIGRVYSELKLRNPALCTVQLSRRLLPDIENHKLNTVARHFAVELLNHHRAGDDARATARIFVNLLEDLRARGFQDLASVRRFSTRKSSLRNKTC